MSTTFRGQVTRIVDGDTFDIQLEVPLPGHRVHWSDRIKLAEVDVPEPSEDAIACQAAVQFVEQWLSGTTCCHITCYERRDKYGRLLGDVLKESGECVSQALILAGLGTRTARSSAPAG